MSSCSKRPLALLVRKSITLEIIPIALLAANVKPYFTFISFSLLLSFMLIKGPSYAVLRATVVGHDLGRGVITDLTAYKRLTQVFQDL